MRHRWRVRPRVSIRRRKYRSPTKGAGDIVATTVEPRNGGGCRVRRLLEEGAGRHGFNCKLAAVDCGKHRSTREPVQGRGEV